MAKQIIEIGEAQSRLLEIVSLVTAGTEVVLADHGTPRVRLVSADPGTARRASAEMRVAGLDRGAVRSMSEDFDAPLPEAFWMDDEGDAARAADES